MPGVVVVGAGIVGASVAYHAARLGADVTVVDRALPASGVTGSSFAWIGASGVGPGPVAALRRSATREYRRLEAELPGVRVRWTGSLEWPPPAPVGAAGELALDEDQAVVDTAVLGVLEPGLRELAGPALHNPGDGAVDPVAVTEALVAGAREHGTRLLVGTTVTALRLEAGRLSGVETSSGFLATPTVVLAAGADVPVLCAPTGFRVPVAPSPAVLVRFAAPDAVVRTLIATPHLEVRRAGDGTLLAALQYSGEQTSGDLTDTARSALARLTTLLRDTDGARVIDARVGWRPMPADGEPVVGPVPGVSGVYLAVTHSGVSLAAAIGRLAALEVVRGRVAPELRGCRAARFLEAPAAGPRPRETA